MLFVDTSMSLLLYIIYVQNENAMVCLCRFVYAVCHMPARDTTHLGDREVPMIRCPEYHPDRNIRWHQWEEEIDAFLGQDALLDLFALYGFALEGNAMRERLANAVAFASDAWDYRRRQRAGERWEVSDIDAVVVAHEEEILACAKELGMTDDSLPADAGDVDAILVLGGARTANYDRAVTAAELRRRCRQESVPVVGLASFRPIGEVEVPHVTRILPDAEAGGTTEYDVMRASLEDVLDTGDVVRHDARRAGDNADWEVCSHRNGIHVMAAPSTDPGRRANTLDTLLFLGQVMPLPPRSRIVCVTSPIYVGYQTAALVPLAIGRGWEIRLVGSRVDASIPQVTTNVLQELKGALDAMGKSLDQSPLPA